jgi:hypothetical protein
MSRVKGWDVVLSDAANVFASIMTRECRDAFCNSDDPSTTYTFPASGTTDKKSFSGRVLTMATAGTIPACEVKRLGIEGFDVCRYRLTVGSLSAASAKNAQEGCQD